MQNPVLPKNRRHIKFSSIENIVITTPKNIKLNKKTISENYSIPRDKFDDNSTTAVKSTTYRSRNSIWKTAKNWNRNRISEFSSKNISWDDKNTKSSLPDTDNEGNKAFQSNRKWSEDHPLAIDTK